MISNTHICRDCVIQQYGHNLFVYRDGKCIHEKINILDVSFAQELSKIVTMIREGEI